MNIRSWDELKREGSAHYNLDMVQMIDIYRAKGTFALWALNEISQHAQRNSPIKKQHDVFVSDMQKIIHYAELLIAEEMESPVGSWIEVAK